MRHCDDDTPAAIALGEPIDSLDAEHAAACTDCAAEVEAFRDIMKRLPPAAGEQLVEPPKRVWDYIEAETSLAAGAPRDMGGDPPAGAAPVDELARRRRGVNPWLVGVAAATAGVVLGAVGMSALRPGGAPETTLVAQAGLADLATETEAGEARVERRADGTEVLVVDTSYTEADGALEVWLIDTEVQGMVSLGFLTADHGEFEIPAGYDVSAFPIVDISVEPADGDPTHSGNSITRGILA